jgi:hypothetical protein
VLKAQQQSPSFKLKLVLQIKIHAGRFSEEFPWLKSALFRGFRGIIKQSWIAAPHRYVANCSIRQDIHDHDYVAVYSVATLSYAAIGFHYLDDAGWHDGWPLQLTVRPATVVAALAFSNVESNTSVLPRSARTLFQDR